MIGIPQSDADKKDGYMAKSISLLPSKEPESLLYKKIPIVKADWDCEIIPNENGEYGYTLIIYKNGEEVKRQSGYGSIQNAQRRARDYVLLEEFSIFTDNKGVNND